MRLRHNFYSLKIGWRMIFEAFFRQWTFGYILFELARLGWVRLFFSNEMLFISCTYFYALQRIILNVWMDCFVWILRKVFSLLTVWLELFRKRWSNNVFWVIGCINIRVESVLDLWLRDHLGIPDATSIGSNTATA